MHIIRAFALSAATCAFLAGPAYAQHNSGGLHDVMSKNMKEMQSMQMTGDVDKDFAMMMKHHHQSGIEMARVQLREGKDPELKKQAQKIVDGQKKEIADLDRWMQSKGGGAKSGTGSSASGAAQPGHSGHGSQK